MADTYWANVVLLCHLDGTNGSTTFVDETGRHTLTATGAAGLVTAQQQFGTASLDVAGAQVFTSDSADWEFGSGRFTVECWIRPTSISGVVSVLTHWPSGSSNLGWFFGFNGNTLNFFYSTTGSDNPVVTGSYTPTLNSWVHVAADRDASNVLRVYANGVVIASATVSATFFDTPANFYIGNDGNSSRPFVGQIDEVRITKGVARYGGAFTVPSAPFDNFGPPTQLQQSTLARETLLAETTATLRQSTLAREVLLSQVTQTWASVMAREILLLGDPVAGVRQTAVSVSVS